MKTKVLVVDDDPAIRRSLKRLIDKEGYKTMVAETGEAALNIMNKENPEIIFLDLRLPGINGLTCLKKIKDINQDTIVFLFSAYGTFKDVVKAMKTGAFDYIPKPYNNEEIKIGLLKASEAIKVKKEVRHLRYQTSLNKHHPVIVENMQMRHILDMAKEVAKSADTPVLIQGETGVGKEVLAQVIHYNSPRRNGPFLTLNCNTIPRGLLESELFGYEKGAFTGANSSKLGLFELAEEGTLLLDEIGDLNNEWQVKLLRILENKTFFKVGGTIQKTSDVRIIASTNRELEKEVKRKNFREDLYYRLNVIKIVIPPLRERKSDIIPLAKYYIDHFNKKFNKKIRGISPKAKDVLLNHEWLGNVRELKNLMERVVLLAEEKYLTIDSLSLNTQNFSSDNLTIHLMEKDTSLDAINKLLIEKVLRMYLGNQVKAAKALGLSRSTLRYRIKKYNINADNFRNAHWYRSKNSKMG